MQDLINKILGYLPSFLSDFGSILAGPKSFVLAKIDDEKSYHNKAYLIFISISITLISIIQMITPVHKEIYASAVSNFVVLFFIIGSLSIVLRAAWWCVGGRAPFEDFFAIYCYYAGAMILISALGTLTAFGMLRILDPQTFDALPGAQTLISRGNLINRSPVEIPFFVLMYSSMVVSTFYGFLGWGAFRKINNLGRMRSFFAMLLSGVFCIPVLLVCSLILLAVA